MVAESIAKVVADLRAARVRSLLTSWADPSTENRLKTLEMCLQVAALSGPVIDATAIYKSLVAKDAPVHLYEDHPCIAPPWNNATICYVNEHGNVLAMTSLANELTDNPGPHWEASPDCAWDRVRWAIDTVLWLGGSSSGMPFPTSGPMMLWRFAVYENGEPGDLHWIQFVNDYPRDNWNMAQLVLLGSLNFLNCRNVELVEPRRPRAESRRIARTGITVSTINVLPIGRSARSERKEPGQGVPLTSVRGHFATYGPEHGRGLLFGKYAGRYWIPQHARGDASLGMSVADYKLVPR